MIARSRRRPTISGPDATSLCDAPPESLLEFDPEKRRIQRGQGSRQGSRVWRIDKGQPVAGSEMLALGDYERYPYAFDRDTQQLHVMSMIPEPSTLVALLSLAVTGLTLLVWRRRKRSAADSRVSC